MNFFKSGGSEGETSGGGLLAKFGAKAADKVVPNHSLCPTMSIKTRVYGWLVCMGIGIFLSFISSGMLHNIIKGKVVKFAVLYTLGTICALASSFFLWGPMK